MRNRQQLNILTLIIFFPWVSWANSDYEELTRGSLRVANSAGSAIEAPLLNTQVSMEITGLIARIKVTQTFSNDQDAWVEGKYLFPLPDNAAVDQLQIKIGERLIVGEIKEKELAKKIYRKAKLSGKKASLVSQKRANIFQNSVANIGPFETIEVSIEYQQDIHYEATSGFSLRFPMTMTQRYQPIIQVNENFNDWTDNYSSQTTFLEELNAPIIEKLMAKNKNASSRKNKVTIQIILNSGIPLESINSNTHKLSQRENASNQYFVQLANENTIADRDFVLRWKPIPARKPRAALFTEQKFGENYLSLMVLPPAQDFIEQQTLPRESIFVIDTSGSMGGESIRQAKQSLLYALDTLTQDDFFNIVEFNSNTRSLFTTAKPVTKSSLNQAKYFVHKLNAGGGTEMRQAMNQALENQNSRNTLRQVFFLTDGAIGNEAQLFDIIESKLGNSRLFTIGIGSAPNTFFMKKAARYGRGTFTYISNANQAADKMTALFEKIRRPQLTHINVQWPQGKQVDMWPKQIPDLYSEEPLWIKAKVEDFQGQLEVSGQLTNGVWQSRFSFDKGTNHPGIATLWAREKIAGIQAQANYGEVTQEEKDSIIKTALKHHLVSRFTSLVAVDKTITRFTQDLTTKMLPLHTPAGSKIQNQSSINYPQTGLDLDIKTKNSLLWILSCFTLLLLLRRFN